MATHQRPAPARRRDLPWVVAATFRAGLALLLGAVGVYGVISHSVLRRSREFGIRLALGQQPALIIRQVTGQALALVLLLVGMLAALIPARRASLTDPAMVLRQP